MTYEQWEAQVPQCIRDDSAWRMRSYRLGLFLFDLAAKDAKRLLKIKLHALRADQLVRAAQNISSSVVEGYSRGTERDRARFYEYSLGSARETRDWYYKIREELGSDVSSHRMSLATQLVRLLLTMVSHERRNLKRLERLENKV